MVRTRKKFPEVHDLILGTVVRIAPYGVYIKLDEYEEREGMVHVSEISSSWVRNIRDHVREKQKVVAKVLRVNKAQNHVDLSIRRVTQQLRRAKIREWKRSQKADKLLEMASKKLKKTLGQAYKQAGWKLEDHYGEILAGLEEAHKSGKKALTEAGLPDEWASELAKLAKGYITIPTVSITGSFDIRIHTVEGIRSIKKALTAGIKTGKEYEDTDISIRSAGAPNYRVKVTSKNYKEAEEALKSIVNVVAEQVEQSGGEANFTRK